MKKQKNYSRRKSEKYKVIKANLKFFSKKAIDYNKEEPSYKQENVKRVSKILKEFLKNKRNARILDIGCGTGFIIDIASKYSSNIIGVDISPEMLNEVNRRNGKIQLTRADTSILPLNDNYFDLCIAYGFLHHLYDIIPTFNEAFRCLRKNGVFYMDQDPNYYFWENARKYNPKEVINEIPKNEIIHVNDPTEGYRKKKLKSLDLAGRHTIIRAEYQKTFKDGFREENILKILKKIGFRKISYNYEWYLGESFAKHKISLNADKLINEHLRRCLPLTRHLFKYVRVIAIK